MPARFDAPRLGLLVSSSNIVIEPLAQDIVTGSNVQSYVARYRVREDQPRPDPLPIGYDGELVVADYLADAAVDLICTTGTAAGWQGLEGEHDLLAALSARLGCPALSLVDAVIAAVRRHSPAHLCFVTPYSARIRDNISRQFGAMGYRVSHRFHEEGGNLERAAISQDVLAALIRAAAQDQPDLIILFCANFDGSRLAPEMTASLGIPVICGVSELLQQAIASLTKTRKIPTATNRVI